MKQKLIAAFNSAIVTVYKLFGFVVLTIILVGLTLYLGLQGFFLVNRHWIAPTVISPSDAKILELNAKLAEQVAVRERIAGERREVQARLNQTERTLKAQRRFQERFQVALAGDRAFRAEELARLARVHRGYARAVRELQDSNRAWSRMEQAHNDRLLEARLVDREQHLATQHKLSQLAQSEVAVGEKEVELDMRLRALRSTLRALDRAAAGLDPKSGSVSSNAANFEVLLLEQEYARSEAEVAAALDQREALQLTLEALDASDERYERLLAAIRSSPYLKATEGNLTVAFVPYDNLAGLEPGARLYGCDLGLFWCHKVGSVVRLLDGEVSLKHPIRSQVLRGVMVEVALEDPQWARQELLHFGRAPLLL